MAGLRGPRQGTCGHLKTNGHRKVRVGVDGWHGMRTAYRHDTLLLVCHLINWTKCDGSQQRPNRWALVAACLQRVKSMKKRKARVFIARTDTP